MKRHSFAIEVIPSLSRALVNKNFQILFGLLEDRVREVTGRAASKVSFELRERIAKFAAGTCPDEERDQMKMMLRENPDLIPVLVLETRALRPRTNESDLTREFSS